MKSKMIIFVLIICLSCVSNKSKRDLETRRNNFRLQTEESLKTIEFSLQDSTFRYDAIKSCIVTNAKLYQHVCFYDINSRKEDCELKDRIVQEYNKLILRRRIVPVIDSNSRYDYIKVNDSLSKVIYDFSRYHGEIFSDVESFIKADLFWNKRRFCSIYFYGTLNLQAKDTISHQ